MILEADKSHDLQLACWRRRSADNVVPVQVRRPETGVSSRLKASRLASQQEPIFQTESQGKKNRGPSQKAVGRSSLRLTGTQPVCFIQAFS